MPNDGYGGTIRLFTKVLAAWGIQAVPVDLTNLAALEQALSIPARLVWCETPTNPLLKVTDISALSDICHAAGALLVVDNTFATPVLQQPLTLGADVVMHSTTKYIGGHSDLIGGALITNDSELGERLHFHQFAAGAIPGPFDAWLTLRGIKTLDVRMARHCDNAEAIVRFLGEHPAADKVSTPVTTALTHIRCDAAAAWSPSSPQEANPPPGPCAKTPRSSPWANPSEVSSPSSNSPAR